MRAAARLVPFVALVLIFGVGCAVPAPGPAPASAPPTIVEPAEGEAIPSEEELSPFVPLGEWVEFTNGTRARVTMQEVSVPADSQYPESYPAVPRALEVIVDIDNPTEQEVDNVFSFGPRFAYETGELQQLLGDGARTEDLPRLVRAGGEAQIIQTFGPAPGTEWPEGAEFTCAVRTPLLVGQEPTLIDDETAEWIGVPTT